MNELGALVKALGVSYAAGINLYATVAVLGLAERLGWVGPLPGALSGVSQWWVIVLAATLYLIDFIATLVPGIASLWDTLHTFIRPPAAALLAVATVWGGDPAVTIAAGLLGGSLALTTNGAKLGARYTIDASPEPFTNGVANLAELGFLSALLIQLWHHPVIALVVALVVLVVVALVVRAVWRGFKRAFASLAAPPPPDRQAGTPRS
jgi:hypothetical protein